MAVRNPFELPAVRGRRVNAQKELLSRDLIVAEALRQITRCGLAGMSMRKVAAALDTGAASLYAYVADLEELHALVLDRALAKVNLRANPHADWRGRLHALLKSYARTLSESPGLAQLAFGSIAVGPNALRINEKLLGLLAEGGVEVGAAAWALDLLLLYVTAIVAERHKGADPVDPAGRVVRAINSLSPLEHPRLYAARGELLAGSASERFSWALDVLLRGVAQAP